MQKPRQIKLAYSDGVLDLDTGVAEFPARVVHLTATEWRLAVEMYQRGTVERDRPGVRTTIARLRNKLGPTAVVNTWGHSYSLGVAE